MELTLAADLPEIFVVAPIRRWIGIRERHGPRPRIPPLDRFVSPDKQRSFTNCGSLQEEDQRRKFAFFTQRSPWKKKTNKQKWEINYIEVRQLGIWSSGLRLTCFDSSRRQNQHYAILLTRSRRRNEGQNFTRCTRVIGSGRYGPNRDFGLVGSFIRMNRTQYSSRLLKIWFDSGREKSIEDKTESESVEWRHDLMQGRFDSKYISV